MSRSRSRLERLEQRYRPSRGTAASHCPICGRPFRPIINSFAAMVRWAQLVDEPEAMQRYCLTHEQADVLRESRERPWRDLVRRVLSKGTT